MSGAGYVSDRVLPHNIHFLWFSATFDGQGRTAIERRESLASKIDDETLKAVPLLADSGRAVLALTRFGQWDEMLKEPEPPEYSAFLRAVWHYARGLSLWRRVRPMREAGTRSPA